MVSILGQHWNLMKYPVITANVKWHYWWNNRTGVIKKIRYFQQNLWNYTGVEKASDIKMSQNIKAASKCKGSISTNCQNILSESANSDDGLIKHQISIIPMVTFISLYTINRICDKINVWRKIFFFYPLILLVKSIQTKKDICLKAVTSLPNLLLQKRYTNSKPKDHLLSLERRLEL